MNLLKQFRLVLFGLFCALTAASSSATVLDWTIEGSGADQIPIAIVPFAAEEFLPQSITAVVGADLARSGLFKAIDPSGVQPPPHEPGEVRYPDWRERGANAVVIGGVAQRPDGKLDVHFRLMDVAKQGQLAGFSYTVARLSCAPPRIRSPT